MGRGGYIGPTEPLGLTGCLALFLPYLFGVGYIIEEYGYGGGPGWRLFLIIVLWTAGAFILALGLSRFVKRLRAK